MKEKQKNKIHLLRAGVARSVAHCRATRCGEALAEVREQQLSTALESVQTIAGDGVESVQLQPAAGGHLVGSVSDDKVAHGADIGGRIEQITRSHSISAPRTA